LFEQGREWTGLARPQYTGDLRETPVDVYGGLDWLATSARDLRIPDIGHAMVRMQHADFVDRGWSNECCWAICWRISGWPLLAAADTAGAEIAEQFRVVMPSGMMIIVGAGA
jgi:hypothetical protein